MTEPCDLSAVALRRLIGTRQLSPVEVLESCIQRIEATNPAVNAIVASCFDRGMAEAKASESAVMRGDRLGALHGIPIGIKDLSETEGLRTTFGSLLHSDYVPARDERIVAAIRAAGGIVVAKTNTPEFGTGGNTLNDVYGATGNAFDPALSCAGSSGGSGVALACSMLPLCSGSDTGGSLRKPAAWSGVVGFRPSPGLIASERRKLGWTVFSVQGPMARDVADAALLLSVMASGDSRDPMADPALSATEIADLADPPRIDLNALRVAYTADFGYAPVASSIRAIFDRRIGDIATLFAQLDCAHPPVDGMDQAYRVLRSAAFLGGFRHIYERDPALLGSNTRTNYEEGLRYSLADAADAHATQTRLYREAQAFFGRYDLLLTLTQVLTPHSKMQLYPTDLDGVPLEGYFATHATTYIPTMLGHPAITIPCGVDHKGMPFGLQLVGPRGADRWLLGVAKAMESVFEMMPSHRRPIPDLARLSQISASVAGSAPG